MITQPQKAAQLKSLHERPGLFIIPNPWDAGTARMLTSLGFEALATTSLGMAITYGRRDGNVTLAETLSNCEAIAAATDLPISADFENAFSDDPKIAAANMLRLAQTGVVGGSIEDVTGSATKQIYDFALAVERVAAVAEELKKLAFPFALVARADNLIHGRLDLDDTIRRLQAYERAGADVLYAPGLRDLQTIKTVVQSLNKPLNVNMNSTDPSITVQDLAQAGVRRISVGGGLARRALAAVHAAAVEMRDQGTAGWVQESLSSAQINSFLR